MRPSVRFIPLSVALFLGVSAVPRHASAAVMPVEIKTGVAQLFVDDFLIDRQVNLRRTLHQPKKDDDGNVPVISLDKEYGEHAATLGVSGTIIYDPRIKRYVMFAEAFSSQVGGADRTGLYRFTSSDGMNWVKGDNGEPERIVVDLSDPVTGRSATHIDTFSCCYDAKDPSYPYKGWLYFANWGDDLEGIYFMRSSDGKTWERGRQIINGCAREEDPSRREILQDGRVLNGGGDVTLFYHDKVANRFLAIIKFYSFHSVGPGNRLRSRAYAFLKRLDEPFDLNRIKRVELVPPAAEVNGDMAYDEYYASTAWRYESLRLGGLKVWHRDGDYPYSAAGCAFTKLVVSRDGLHWKKVPFNNDAGIPEVFIPNGAEGGNGGRNDGGYMSQFSQGPLRIGDELIYYYGASSYGKNYPGGVRISGGGVFRARLRIDGFVSVDGGSLTTKPLAFQGRDLFANAVGPVVVEALDTDGNVVGSATVKGDSPRHKVRFNGRSLHQVAKRGVVRLRFTVKEKGRLYSFTVR